MKYNLYYDLLLDLNLFDKNVFDLEINYYMSQKMDFGVDLDNRALYAKADW